MQRSSQSLSSTALHSAATKRSLSASLSTQACSEPASGSRCTPWSVAALTHWSRTPAHASPLGSILRRLKRAPCAASTLPCTSSCTPHLPGPTCRASGGSRATVTCLHSSLFGGGGGAAGGGDLARSGQPPS